MGYLYVLEINPLSVASCANIFSHSEGCPFISFMVSFAVQKLLSLIISHLFIFVFISITLGMWVKKGLAEIYVKECSVFSKLCDTAGLWQIEFSLCNSTASANRQLYPFWFWWPLFIYLAWFLWLGFPVLYWMEVTRVSILVLLQILEEKFQLFTIEYDISCGFVIHGLFYVVVHPLSSKMLGRFYHEKMWNFVECFLCVDWDDYMIFYSPFC